MPQFDRAYKLGALILECVCAKLLETTAGCPGRRCLVPGAVPEHVDCCEGQLTVNILRGYPSFDFPNPAIGSITRNNCEDAPYTVITYAVQIIRCAPVGTPRKAPTCDKLDESAFTTMIDMDAVRQGVICCLRDTDTITPVAGEPFKWVLGDQETYGPEGGCVGSTAIVLAGLPTCLEC